MLEETYRHDLEQQLKSPEFREAFERLRREHVIFEKYPTVESLCALINPNNKTYAHKDEVMTALLNELGANNIIYPLINMVFWDSLMGLYRRYRLRVANQEELFSRIQWNFYQSVIAHDVGRLPEKIVVNIFLNTKKRIVAWQTENIRERKRKRELVDLYKAGIEPGALAESPVHPEEKQTYLLEMVYRKIITKTQYDLILETLVYKQMNQRVWAELRGIPYNTVRNLRYRAEMAIRGYEEGKNTS